MSASNPGWRESITSGVIEFGEMAVIATPSLPATNAKRLCKGAQATKQSTLALSPPDCFASARNDGRFHADQSPASFRRRHENHRRRQLLAGQDQPGLLGVCRAVRRL